MKNIYITDYTKKIIDMKFIDKSIADKIIDEDAVAKYLADLSLET